MFGEDSELEPISKGQLTAVFGNNFIRLDELVSMSVGADFSKPKNSPLRYFVACIYYNGNSYQYNGSKDDMYAFLLSLEERGFYNGKDMPSVNKFMEDLERKAAEYERMMQEEAKKQAENVLREEWLKENQKRHHKKK